MTEGLQFELKTLSMAVGLAINLIALGWFAASVTYRIDELEKDSVEARAERKEMGGKLIQLQVISATLQRIEADIKDLKHAR